MEIGVSFAYSMSSPQVIWFFVLWSLAPSLSAQSLGAVVIGAAGGTLGTPGGGSVSWTLGETAVEASVVDAPLITQGFQQGAFVRVRVNLRAFLQGPWNTSASLMGDGLRVHDLIPQVQPYSITEYPVVACPFTGWLDASVLEVVGEDAIVDWVYLQLRDRNDHTLVVASRRALIQRDGDVVDVDGTSPVIFWRPASEYFISVQHRNHLSILTLNSILLASTPVLVDLTDGSVGTYGTNAQCTVAGTRLLWCGDVNDDAAIKYVGMGNDRDPILVTIGGVVPTNTVQGYIREDVTMDGLVKYVGSNNDRDPILVNIGGNTPTVVRSAQMP